MFILQVDWFGVTCWTLALFKFTECMKLIKNKTFWTSCYHLSTWGVIKFGIKSVKNKFQTCKLKILSKFWVLNVSITKKLCNVCFKKLWQFDMSQLKTAQSCLKVFFNSTKIHLLISTLVSLPALTLSAWIDLNFAKLQLYSNKWNSTLKYQKAK